MSSSHRSSHHHSSSSHSSSSSSKSKGKGHSSSSSKSHKDDWSDITDPDERRRVQNRIAQRKFRDKAKEAKERQEREARDQAHAGNAYHTPDPNEMGGDDQLSGLPWGSLSLKYVVSRGKARESESWRGSPKDEERSYDGSQGQASDDRDGHYEDDSAYYGEGDHPYYDYGSASGSGRGGGSR